MKKAWSFLKKNWWLVPLVLVVLWYLIGSFRAWRIRNTVKPESIDAACRQIHVVLGNWLGTADELDATCEYILQLQEDELRKVAKRYEEMYNVPLKVALVDKYQLHLWGRNVKQEAIDRLSQMGL